MSCRYDHWPINCPTLKQTRRPDHPLRSTNTQSNNTERPLLSYSDVLRGNKEHTAQNVINQNRTNDIEENNRTNEIREERFTSPKKRIML